MSTTSQQPPRPIVTTPYPPREARRGSAFAHYLRTTDPKDIAILYLVTSFAFFMIGGLMALLMRAELAQPGLQILSVEQYNQLFTMHGTIMLLLFATPLFAGFANALVPLQIGSPDVAFPRLNMFAFWLYFFGGLIAAFGFLTPQGAAAFGWFAYAPLSNSTFSPGLGGNLWVFGLGLGGFGTILGSVNFITTIVCMRAPGMTMFRMPLFTWTVLITSILAIVVFPVLAAAMFGLGMDRVLGAHVFDPETGEPMTQVLMQPQPVMGPDGQPVVDPMTGMPAMQPQPVVIGYDNRVADMDMDIIVDTVPDTANLAVEQFQMLSQLAQAYGPEKVPFEVMLDLSSIPNKRQVKEKLEKGAAVPPQVQQMQQAAVELDRAEKQAEIQHTESQTAKNLADIRTQQAEMLLEGLKLDMQPIAPEAV
mgnify:CR=1 FL=1